MLIIALTERKEHVENRIFAVNRQTWSAKSEPVALEGFLKMPFLNSMSLQNNPE